MRLGGIATITLHHGKKAWPCGAMRAVVAGVVAVLQTLVAGGDMEVLPVFLPAESECGEYGSVASSSFYPGPPHYWQDCAASLEDVQTAVFSPVLLPAGDQEVSSSDCAARKPGRNYRCQLMLIGPSTSDQIGSFRGWTRPDQTQS